MLTFTQFLKESQDALNESVSGAKLSSYINKNLDEEETKEAFIWVIGSVLNQQQIKKLGVEIKSAHGGNPATTKAMVDYVEKKVDAEDCSDLLDFAIGTMDEKQLKTAYDYISDLY